MGLFGAVASGVSVPGIRFGRNNKFGGVVKVKRRRVFGQWAAIKREIALVLRNLRGGAFVW